jgi:hypothetical protein
VSVASPPAPDGLLERRRKAAVLSLHETRR